jgi:hypothetical protein
MRVTATTVDSDTSHMMSSRKCRCLVCKFLGSAVIKVDAAAPQLLSDAPPSFAGMCGHVYAGSSFVQLKVAFRLFYIAIHSQCALLVRLINPEAAAIMPR